MRALVLSGGGAKGAYQVGVLSKWMMEDGRDYDLICGVSVGALNGAVLASARAGDPKAAWLKLDAFWRNITTAKVRKPWPVFGAAAAMWKPSVYDSSPLAAWAYKELSAKTIRASGRQLVVGAVCWETGEYRVADQTSDDIVSWVLASSAYPVFMSPVKIGDRLWTDGGVREVTPLGAAIKRGATEIDVILCDPPKPTPWSPRNQAAVPGFALRPIELLLAEIVENDLTVCGLKNELAELSGKYKKLTVRVVRPSFDLEVDSLSFTSDTTARLVDLGYADALRDHVVLL